MNKFKKYIETWLNGNKVRGIVVSPYDIYECVRVYKDLISNKQSESINGKVKEVLAMCKINTEVKEIGWEATI